MMRLPIHLTLKRRFRLMAVLLFAALLFPPFLCRAETFKDTRTALGTSVTVLLWTTPGDKRAQKVVEDVFAEFERIEAAFSPYRESSEISRINARAGMNPVKVSEETMTMLQEGVRLATISGKAFDITFDGAGKLYSFESGKGIVPTRQQIEQAQKVVGIEHLILNPAEKTAYLDAPGARIGLGGYVKGYAVDRACAVIRRAGIRDFIVNAGGDMYVAGAKGQTSWRIGIQAPRGKRDELTAALTVKDRAVVTSGDYERFFMHEGVRYHHILDARTGRPARLCQSVTVIADSSMAADALATIVFILGPREGIELIEKEQGASCFVIDAKGGRHFSSGFLKSCAFETIEETGKD